MKLFVIVLCLLSERYLIHRIALTRFHWFPAYFNKINQMLPKEGFLSKPIFRLAAVIIPVIVLGWLLLIISHHVLFGFLTLLINLVVFYYCLGPENPFYPITEGDSESAKVSDFFYTANSELFAVIFWYIITGPLGLLTYRLLTLSKEQAATQGIASVITDALDWITVRISLVLYLLAGNFQQGFHYFRQQFFSAPANNKIFLSTGGELAAQANDKEVVTLPSAQNLVELALIIYLVFIAFFTMAAWL